MSRTQICCTSQQIVQSVLCESSGTRAIIFYFAKQKKDKNRVGSVTEIEKAQSFMNTI